MKNNLKIPTKAEQKQVRNETQTVEDDDANAQTEPQAGTLTVDFCK